MVNIDRGASDFAKPGAVQRRRRLWPWLFLPLLAALMTISAAPASAATITFTPAFSGGGLGEGATLSAELTFTGTEYDGLVAPPRRVAIHLPAGTSGTSAGFPTCTESTLAQYGVAGCPAGSMAGPSGSIEWLLSFGGERINEKGTVQAVFAAGEHLLLYIDSTAPVAIELVAEATYGADTPPYGRVLELELPLVETVPGAPLASVTALDLELGATRKEGPATVNSVTVPEQCPQSGRFGWASEVTLYEQAPQQTLAETACSAAGKIATTTTLQTSDASPTVGELLTYTATVTPNAAPISLPTGSVEFLDAGAPVAGCLVQPLIMGTSAATATCQVSYPAAGPHSITATYGGDSNFLGSLSPATMIAVRSSSAAGGGGGVSPGTTPVAGSTTGPGTSPPGTQLTLTQKLAKALKACKRERSKHRRKACEASAKRRYTAKSKRRTKGAGKRKH